jgi:hypothetical protein
MQNVRKIAINYVVSNATETSDHKKTGLKVEYLGKFEYMYETALTCGSGPRWQMELFDEKSRDRVPLSGKSFTITKYSQICSEVLIREYLYRNTHKKLTIFYDVDL